MTPAEAIDQLILVPHVPGQGTWQGADCWGIVELWYRHVLGIDVADRGQIDPGASGLQSGFDVKSAWREVTAPADHCLVIMRAGRLAAGHVGIFYSGSVLHSSQGHDCVYQPVTDRAIRALTTCYLERK